MATNVSHRLSTTQAHAIADLTGYEDADTLRWQQAGVTAQQYTGAQGRDAGTDTDRLAHGLDLAPRGEEPLIPPDTAPPVPQTSLQEGPAAAGPGATTSRPERARRTRTVRTHRGQARSPDGERRQLAHQRSACLDEREAQGGQHGAHVHGARYQ